MTNSYSSGHTEPLATDRRPVSGEKLMKALAEASYVWLGDRCKADRPLNCHFALKLLSVLPLHPHSHFVLSLYKFTTMEKNHVTKDKRFNPR
jgi:hypothetical protein